MNEEHNMTLRERYYVWNKKLDDYPSAKMSADWFLSQFDVMLAEDIEKIGYVDEEFLAQPYCEEFSEEWSLYMDRKRTKSILEARRLSLKK